MPTITSKVSPDEASRIRRLARRVGCIVSEFLRRRATEEARAAPSAEGYRIESSRVTGLPVMRAPEGIAVVTSDQVRALLADFP